MDNDMLARVAARTAAEVCERYPLEEAARRLLRGDLTPRDYLGLLLAGRQYPEAVRFLAHALPKREAVWWACQCVRLGSGTNAPPVVATALAAAEMWAADPSEDNRRAALPAAEAAGLRTPAGCAAVAAFWSAGSLGPPNVPAIPPDERLTAQGAAGAVLLAAVQTEPEKAPVKYHHFLAAGLEVARGTDRWQEPKR
jgi:hypothetical protein